jgi:molybdopterin-guanine dinucleotide biosynthesis protein A
VSASSRPAALLLTGGASRRLGRDKAAILVGGVPLARRTAALLVEVAEPVIEVGPGYTGLAQVREVPAGAGPLAAMAAGWTALAAGGRPRAVLVVATDLPQLTGGLLALLASHPGVGCVVPVDRSGRPQTLCARYPAAALARSVRLVAAGRRAVRTLLDGEEVSWLPPDVWEPAAGRALALADLDTPDDLARLVPEQVPQEVPQAVKP